MDTKHTPCPWNIQWGMTQGGDGHHVVDSRDMAELSIISTIWFHDDGEGETKANARLIAAAPELLEALWAMVTSFHAVEYMEPHMQQSAAMARAAIAKATGQ